MTIMQNSTHTRSPCITASIKSLNCHCTYISKLCYDLVHLLIALTVFMNVPRTLLALSGKGPILFES